MRPGTEVVRKDNPRHRGTVVAVIYGEIKVRWENGWSELTSADELLVTKHQAFKFPDLTKEQ